MMRAVADVMFSLLTSGFVLSPSPLLFLNSVHSFCSVCPASQIATGSIVSCGTHHVINPSRPSPTFRTARDKSWAWRPGNEASSDYR